MDEATTLGNFHRDVELDNQTYHIRQLFIKCWKVKLLDSLMLRFSHLTLTFKTCSILKQVSAQSLTNAFFQWSHNDQVSHLRDIFYNNKKIVILEDGICEEPKK